MKNMKKKYINNMKNMENMTVLFSFQKKLN